MGPRGGGSGLEGTWVEGSNCPEWDGIINKLRIGGGIIFTQGGEMGMKIGKNGPFRRLRRLPWGREKEGGGVKGDGVSVLLWGSRSDHHSEGKNGGETPH